MPINLNPTISMRRMASSNKDPTLPLLSGLLGVDTNSVMETRHHITTLRRTPALDLSTKVRMNNTTPRQEVTGECKRQAKEATIDECKGELKLMSD